LLDRIIARLTEEGKIVKSGKGLLWKIVLAGKFSTLLVA
jgi:hypothetical protein